MKNTGITMASVKKTYEVMVATLLPNVESFPSINFMTEKNVMSK
jgi:hypothetical protein